MPYRDYPRYAILGAGISGLSLAWFLKKYIPNAQISLIEAKDRAGGWMETSHASNFLFEKGPHSMRLSSSYKNSCLELIHDMKLDKEVLTANPTSNKKYLAFNNDLHDIKSLLPKLLIKSAIPLFKGLFQKSSNQDESIQDFCHRYLGKDLTNTLIDPLVMGITGGNLDILSVQSLFPNLHAQSQKKGPLLVNLLKSMQKNKTEIISFKKGFSSLVDALRNKIEADIFLNETVKFLDLGKEPKVITKDFSFECDHIFSSLPSNALYSLIEDKNFESALFLKEQAFVSYKIVHIGFEKLSFSLNGFGYIAPSWSQQKVSGVIFDSEIFPSQNSSSNQTRLTAMVHQNSPLFKLTHEYLEKEVLRELKTLFKKDLKPSFLQTTALKNAIPQYNINHLNNIHAFERELNQRKIPLTCLGNSFYGVSVPSCIYKSHETAKNKSRLFFHEFVK